MNGRVYDPSIGRFLSADPNIQALYNTQSYNRYSYVLNNPLKYSDPSGFWSERITNAFRYNPYFKAAGAIIAFAYGGPEGVVLYSAGLASLSGAKCLNIRISTQKPPNTRVIYPSIHMNKVHLINVFVSSETSVS
jgi:uncharacterized protein RhaS with RHS repeats